MNFDLVRRSLLVLILSIASSGARSNDCGGLSPYDEQFYTRLPGGVIAEIRDPRFYDARNVAHWTENRVTPKREDGAPEFNIYWLFACPEARNIKRLVLMRFRHSKSPTPELVGKMELPQSAVERARRIVVKKRGAQVQNITLGRCTLVGETKEQINALLPAPATEEDIVKDIKPHQVVFAWKVDPNKTILEEVPRSAIRLCWTG